MIALSKKLQAKTMQTAPSFYQRPLALGIELGSTRIKCILIDASGKVLSTGIYQWENHFENNLWTYSLKEAVAGIAVAYLSLKHEFQKKDGFALEKIDYIGVSAMMHGLLALDEQGRLLTPFRTWRNNNAEKAAALLSNDFDFHIPARWSCAHLYQAAQEHEPFVGKIAHLLTLSAYINHKLGGALGIGKDDASGMFPLDENGHYDGAMEQIEDALLKQEGYSITMEAVLPKIYAVNESVGTLSKEGAQILDPEGDLLPGSLLCPPEGDAATGMVSTNTVEVGSGNISVGTSIFGSFITDKNKLPRHEEVDIVATPEGKKAAMIHCNNCTSGIDACAKLIKETLALFGEERNDGQIYDALFKAAYRNEGKDGALLAYNYLSGENITQVKDGALLLACSEKSTLSLPNLMVAEFYSTFATFALGMDLLAKDGVVPHDIIVHGGIFKTPKVAQSFLASILNQAIALNPSASEGGAWGMAILALYLAYAKRYSLSEFLAKVPFKDVSLLIEDPQPQLHEGFLAFQKTYLACLKGEKAIGEGMVHSCSKN
jgi:sugar (pentulose or hexulose) kinase